MHMSEYTLCSDSVIFKKPVCPQTDTIWDIPNQAMKILYFFFVIDMGVAVLCKYEVGETL